jgi:predicted RNA polymerase sigma factor
MGGLDLAFGVSHALVSLFDGRMQVSSRIQAVYAQRMVQRLCWILLMNISALYMLLHVATDWPLKTCYDMLAR